MSHEQFYCSATTSQALAGFIEQNKLEHDGWCVVGACWIQDTFDKVLGRWRLFPFGTSFTNSKKVTCLRALHIQEIIYELLRPRPDGPLARLVEMSTTGSGGTVLVVDGHREDHDNAAEAAGLALVAVLRDRRVSGAA